MPIAVNTNLADISSIGVAANQYFAASAILLDNSTNEQFLNSAFETLAPIDIKAGCLMNSTFPGPCTGYADGLDPSQTYYLWAVTG